jgi:hypothetical protein
LSDLDKIRRTLEVRVQQLERERELTTAIAQAPQAASSPHKAPLAKKAARGRRRKKG